MNWMLQSRMLIRVMFGVRKSRVFISGLKLCLVTTV